jgi:predicted DNA-binding protein with PD1-like motif
MEDRIRVQKCNKGRLIVGRILPGTDLFAGIKKICLENNLRYGSIVSMIGSLSKGKFVYAIDDEKAKLKFKYSDPVYLQGPLELLSAQGFIGLGDNGEINIHLHGLMSDKYMRLFGGHFVEGGNPILATMEIMIQELDGVKLLRGLDQETGFTLFEAYEG